MYKEPHLCTNGMSEANSVPNHHAGHADTTDVQTPSLNLLSSSGQNDADMIDIETPSSNQLQSSPQIDTDMTGVQTPSHQPMELQSPEPIERGFNVASLCNPNHEDPELRRVHGSGLSSAQLDMVQKPSWIQPSTCEQFGVYNQYKLTIYAAEFEIFLSGLTIDSIDRAIDCFNEAVNSHKILPSDFDPRKAQLSCARLLQLVARGSTATTTVNCIPSFWSNLDGLVHSSNMNAIEASMIHVFYMQGALKIHQWLLDIVPAAVERISKRTWLDELVADVRLALGRKGGATFSSQKYLPGLLAEHRAYHMEAKPFRYDQRELIITTVSSIVRRWLHFPPDEQSLLQLSLLDIVTSKSPTSILFLDKIWDMYRMPFSTVFHNPWNVRKSKTKLDTALRDFQQEYAAHPFATAGSLEHRKLEYLSKLIHQWLRINNMGTDDTAVTVSKANYKSTRFY